MKEPIRKVHRTETLTKNKLISLARLKHSHIRNSWNMKMVPCKF